MSPAEGDTRGGDARPYARYRTQIDDPALREALLRQVRGTVNGLRQAYAVHMAAALAALILTLVLPAPEFLGAWMGPLLAGLVLAALMALGGFRSVAMHPARWILPLLGLDLLLVLGLTLLSGLGGAFSVAWLLGLILPLTLLVNLRDARAIAPLLAEHAAQRTGNAKDA